MASGGASAASGAIAAVPKLPESPTALPAGWEEHYDDNSQHTYYYHVESGTTTWDRPAADKDPSPPAAEPPATNDPGGEPLPKTDIAAESTATDLSLIHI